MTLPANPTLQQVNTELGRAAGFAFDMNSDQSARILAQVAAAPNPWQMSSLAGKSSSNNSFFVGQNGSDLQNYGFTAPGVPGTPPFGSISPGTLRGVQIIELDGYFNSGSGLGQFNLSLSDPSGTMPDNFWYAMILKTSANAAPFFSILRSARFNFSNNPPYASWQFFDVAGLNLPSLVGQTLFVNFTY